MAHKLDLDEKLHFSFLAFSMDSMNSYLSTSRVIELEPDHISISPYSKKVVHALFQGNPGIIMFYTDWCGWCKKAKPDYHRFSNTNMGLAVAAFNCDKTDAHKQIARAIGIQSFPTFVYVRNEKGIINMDKQFQVSIDQIRNYI